MSNRIVLLLQWVRSLVHNLCVVSYSFYGFLELFNICGVEEGSFRVRIQESKGRTEFFSGLGDLGSSVKFFVSNGVVDNLDSFEISFKLDKVFHHLARSGVQLDEAVLVEIFQPELFKGSSDVFWLEFPEDILNFGHGSGISTFFLHFLLKEAHEVGSNGGIDEDISIEARVVVSLKDFDVPDLWKVAYRICI